jgi:small subunit ribosomal protein S1
MSAVIENFEELLESSFVGLKFEKGAVINAQVVDVRSDRVTLNAGLKSDCVIAIEEFSGEEVKVGDSVEVVIESLENGFGETCLSREKAIRAKAWLDLQKKFDDNETVLGVLTERVKGGFTVQVGTIKAFLPGSLVDVKPIRDPGYLEGKELDFKIVKMDERRNNIVVSRRAVMESETSAERQARLGELQEGQEVVGIVKNITDYGAFVDLGGVDGLLHITDMAWKRVKHPADVLAVGDELRVKILSFDLEKSRVSLGIKQLGDDPWADISRRYPEGARLKGVVTNITDYGCFVELEEGVEGLVHMSEMDWTNKNVHPSKVVKAGTEVEVMVLGIDAERRRISLGLKQCQMNPWEAFSEKYQKDMRVVGNIRSITDFGIFIGLEGGIDGLVHLSDISWTETGEDAVKNFSKGQEVESIILAVDPERERISLGIKQMDSDPVSDFVKAHSKDELFSAEVVEVDAKYAMVKIPSQEDTQGILRIQDFSYDRIDSLTDELKVGDSLDVKLLGIDRKVHQLQFSHKVNDQLIQDHQEEESTASRATLGDLLKSKMDGES